MVGHAQSAQSFLTSLVIEGVFERIPNLKIVLVEDEAFQRQVVTEFLGKNGMRITALASGAAAERHLRRGIAMPPTPLDGKPLPLDAPARAALVQMADGDGRAALTLA